MPMVPGRSAGSEHDRAVTVSSGIRRKLGLGERDVNIDAYLRQIIDMLRQTRQGGR